MGNGNLYKYRGTSRLEHTLDILINRRMYAAKFEELNDPMEGWYTYNPETLNEDERNVIFEGKRAHNLLCLSETYDNILMWSHYAENNRGMVIGVSVNNRNAKVKPIKYVRNLPHIDETGENPTTAAKNLLTQKLKMWEYEREQRAFISGKPHSESYIGVEVRELIFGFKMDEGLEQLLREVAKRFCPEANLRKFNRDEFNISHNPHSVY